MITLKFNTECQVHRGDYHIVKILHRTSMNYTPTEDEKYCYVCDTEMKKARKLAQQKKLWICPVCGTETKNVNGKFEPPISFWKDSYNIEKKVE